MSYTIRKKLPAIEEIIQAIPLSDAGQQKVLRDREEVKNILAGKDRRLLMIIGPCSAWPKTAVLEYAARLAQLNNTLQDVLKVVMRVYIQKPRTINGWAGPINQPDPLTQPDIETGMRYTRDMMIKVIEMGLPIADEALFTHNAKGFLELLSWVAIGARSSENQTHRVFASAINCAVGLKNPTHGSLAIAVNSVVAAQHSHVAVLDGHEVQTHGNAFAHVVLRGANHAPNYSVEHLLQIKKYMNAHQVSHPSVIIDTSHDNCIRDGKKNPALQSQIIFDVLKNLQHQPELKNLIKGFMVESYLKEGRQQIDIQQPERIDLQGLSITDPCLGWEQTETMLLALAKVLRKS